MNGEKKIPYLAAGVVFALSLAYFLSYIQYGLAYDEGYLLDGVERVMEGELIYRDFHHTYAPGRFYLMAAAFRIFGKSLLVERFVFALFQALKCGVGFLTVWFVVRNRYAYILPVLVMLAPGPWHKVFFSSLGFLATFAMLVLSSKRGRWVVLSGVIVGSCAVFRQDVAGFALLGGLTGLLLGALSRRAGLGALARRLGYLALGIAVVVVPVIAYFHTGGALGAMVHKVTRDGMLDNMTNRIPYPALFAQTGTDLEYVAYIFPVRLLFYLPFLVYALVGIMLARAAVLRRFKHGARSLLVLLIVSVLAFNQSVWRSDVGHLLQTMQYVFLLVPIVLARGVVFLGARARGRVWTRSLRYILPVLAPLLLAWATGGILKASFVPALAARFGKEGISVGDTEYLGSILVRKGNDTKLDLGRAPVYVRASEARFFSALGRFLDANTSPGEYVLAVPQLQMLYFFYDRRNPTAYAHYRRRLEPAAEERYIRDIQSHGTRFILLTEPYEGAKLGWTRQAFSEYASRVRQWIFDNYTTVDRIGQVRILRRRS